MLLDLWAYVIERWEVRGPTSYCNGMYRMMLVWSCCIFSNLLMCSFVGTVLLIRKATLLGHNWLRGESRKQELHRHQWTDERVRKPSRKEYTSIVSRIDEVQCVLNMEDNSNPSSIRETMKTKCIIGCLSYTPKQQPKNNQHRLIVYLYTCCPYSLFYTQPPHINVNWHYISPQSRHSNSVQWNLLMVRKECET